MLPSLFHVSLGAPAPLEQPSDPTEPSSNTSQAVLKELEYVFRKGKTVNDILKRLGRVRGEDEVDLRELSKAVVAHILSGAGSEQTPTALSEEGQMPASAETKEITLPVAGDEMPQTDASGNMGQEDIEEAEVTFRPQTTRSQRQTTPLTTDVMQSGATLPVVPSSTTDVRIAEATAATRRWLDASKKMDSVTSTPMPEKDSEDDQVADSPKSPYVSPTPDNENEETQQEATTQENASRRDMPSASSMEDEDMATEAPEEVENDGSLETEVVPAVFPTDSEETESMPDSFVGAAAVIEPAPSPGDSESHDSEVPEIQKQADENTTATASPKTEPSENTETTTTEMDYVLDEDTIPYGQDEADYLVEIPFNPQVKRTTATTTTTENVENREIGTEPVTTAVPVSPTIMSSGSDEEVPTGKPEESVTESNQTEDEVLSGSAQTSGEEIAPTQISEEPEEEEDNQQQANMSGDTIKSPASATKPLLDTPPIDTDNITTAVAAAPPTTPTTEVGSLATEINISATAVPSKSNRSSTVGQRNDTAPVLTPTTGTGSNPASKVKSIPLPASNSSSTPKQSPATSAPSSVMTDPQTTLESITGFQAPLRLLLINELGADFSRLTAVFRRPNLTDPLPDISTIVSEALSSIRVQHLRSPTKRDAVEKRDALHLNVNGVRVEVNVTRQPIFVQHGATALHHVHIDRRQMYVRLVLHFHNVSAHLNFSVAADLFPPFFAVRRASGEAHVEVGEVVVPLRIPFKLYFQKKEGKAAATGVLMPEDFVTHGASMLNVSTHFADCGERDFHGEGAQVSSRFFFIQHDLLFLFSR